MKKGILFRKGFFGYKKKDVLDYFEGNTADTARILADKDAEIADITAEMETLREKMHDAQQKMQFYKNDNQDLRDSNKTLADKLQQMEAEMELLKAEAEDKSAHMPADVSKAEELETLLVAKNNEIAMLKNRLMKGATGTVTAEAEDGGALMVRIKELNAELQRKDEEFYRQKQEYLAMIMKQTEDKKQADRRIRELEDRLSGI